MQHTINASMFLIDVSPFLNAYLNIKNNQTVVEIKYILSHAFLFIVQTNNGQNMVYINIQILGYFFNVNP